MFLNIFVEKIALILSVIDGFRPSPEIVARFALSGSCPAGQDDKVVICRLNKR
jgi:hypothetical protein